MSDVGNCVNCKDVEESDYCINCEDIQQCKYCYNCKQCQNGTYCLNVIDKGDQNGGPSFMIGDVYYKPKAFIKKAKELCPEWDISLKWNNQMSCNRK